MSRLTTIMYHYVRPIKQSRYPGIKGLEHNLFIEQIKYLKRHYNFVTMEDVFNAIYNDASLPERAVLLTFDDAYLDHFLYVYPTLKKYKIQGSFFAPVRAVCEGQVLDVNKIHFILSINEHTINVVISETKVLFERLKKKYSLKDSFDTYYNNLAISNRFDTKEVIFIKRLLQVELPEKMRSELTASLFEKYIGMEQEAFAKELYMNRGQVTHMVSDGMHFGAHGNNHYWWDCLNSEQLDNEFNESSRFLSDVGIDKSLLTASYPYGAYNDLVLEKMKVFNYKLGFTTRVDIAQIKTDNPLEISRLDTNDIPKDSTATPDKWSSLA